MNTKPSLMVKKKSLKNKKTKYAEKCIWCALLSGFKNNKKRNNTIIKDEENTSPMVEHCGNTPEVIPSAKKLQKSHIIRIPRIGCTIPYLTSLFNGLCNSGAACFDEGQMVQAINVVAKAKKDHDEGIKWNGNIEISENIKLKLYKTGLVLHYKF